MRAAVLVKTGQPLQLLDGIDVPQPQRGQVLVRIAYTGICRSQLMETRGLRGEDRWLPHLLGHEASGEVVSVGEGVQKVRPGDAVVVGWIKGEGLDVGGGRFLHRGQVINAGPVATFGEFALVSENRCVPKPDTVPMDVASLLGCAVPTGAGMVMNELELSEGDRVAVIGLGGIGVSALMALGSVSLSQLIAVDVVADKLDLARRLGATDVVDASRVTDVVGAVRALCPGGVDVVVEASGRTEGIEQGFAAIRSGGLCLFASHPEAGAKVCLDPFEFICGKRLKGSWGGATRPDRDLPRFATAYTSGALPLDQLFGRRYSLSRINEAMDDMEAGLVNRALIEVCPD